MASRALQIKGYHVRVEGSECISLNGHGEMECCDQQWESMERRSECVLTFLSHISTRPSATNAARDKRTTWHAPIVNIVMVAL